MSINELKVHFLGSTKLVPDAPYQELDKLVLQRTKYASRTLKMRREFYREAAAVMELKHYKVTMEEDFALLCKVMLPATQKQIQELMKRYVEKCLRHYIKHRHKQYVHALAEVPESTEYAFSKRKPRTPANRPQR